MIRFFKITFSNQNTIYGFYKINSLKLTQVIIYFASLNETISIQLIMTHTDSD